MTLTQIADFLFFCTHENASWVFRDRQGEYRRCLDCGRRISYDFASLGAVKIDSERLAGFVTETQ
jgi:hypothetical protein